MGHLVNATAFRLGWHTTWSNFWYSQIKFGYSNFVFLCVRLRAFLRFFFFHRAMDKSLFIFSHFEIIKNFKFLYIKIYGYFNSLLIFMPKIFRFMWRFMKRWRARFYRSLRHHLSKMFYSENEKGSFYNKYRFRLDSRARARLYRTFSSFSKNVLRLGSNRKHRQQRKQLFKDAKFRWSTLRRVSDDKSAFLTGYHVPLWWGKRQRNRRKNWKIFKSRKAHYFSRKNKNKNINIRKKYILFPKVLNFVRLGKSVQSLQSKLSFFCNKIIPISDYKVYFKQYPLSFGGRWWDYAASSNINSSKNTDCVWLFFNETQRDTSVLRSLRWKRLFFFKRRRGVGLKRGRKSRLANVLLNILNKREQQLDYALDGIKTEANKFSFTNLEFVDALLDNLYDYLSLSKEQRIVRKLSTTRDEVIVAIIYAFRCQRRFFRMWREKPYKWRRLLNRKEKIRIYNIYFYYWKGFKFENKIRNLKRYFNSRNIKQRRVWIKNYFSIKHKTVNLSKINLFKKFQKCFPKREYYAIFRKRVFCAALLLILNFINYRKFTSFDMSYFNVLVRALQSFNIKLLRKFFLLRWRTNGGLLLRTNMRQYFILSSLLSASNNEISQLRFKRRRRGNREIYFNKYIFGIIHELFLEKYIKPIASCFTVRLADSFRAIIPNFEYFVQFYLITNNQVNAQFLARYIAKKLEYHHRLKGLLNPLKREFKYLGRATKLTFKQHMKKVSEKESWKTNMKILWKSLLLILIINYDKISKQYYNLNNLKISFELFNLMKWVKDYTLKKSMSSFYFLKLVYERRALFLWSFTQNITQHLSNFTLSFGAINFFKIITYSQFRYIFHNLVYDWFILKSSLLSDVFTLFYHSNMVYLKFGYFQYKRYLNFNYNMSSYALFKNFNFSNNLHTRLQNIKPNQAQFLGFKIKCSGRFSRKQRASSYWFSLGSVPLNTLTATIDYSMYTVPLANSSITIKVWINRLGTVDNLFYIHII